ncbi:nucleotidyltransferase domain-containing protein [Thalassobacillus sp. CUG 92003]|uniref:nucleotidyltransferase domain-containing protein n=1 Tax=Thalassobacillus sp. CUG 92003 TaxID=2736641 RepID=UPI0015E7DB01|nr:hypothetical protein [Thalassobacillus sp. CUG 92003]
MFELCQRAADWMQGYEGKWLIAGGWAIDLHIGEVTREHHDIEVAVFREDQRELQRLFQGWTVKVAKEKELVEWDLMEHLAQPLHEIHVNHEEDHLEILLNERKGRYWQFRRNHDITYPLSHMHLRSEQGFPYLNPEIVLLYKAKATSDKDEADFQNVFPFLNERQKEWLKQALIQCYPQHRWLEQLLY